MTTETVVVRLKSESGGRLTARAKRLEGFGRKAGPAVEVLADLKAALARAALDRAAEKTRVRICLHYTKGNRPTDAGFYSALGQLVSSGLTFHIVDAPMRRSGRREAAHRPAEAPLRARLAADWPRNASAAPLVLTAGGIGGGLAAAAGIAPFWAAAPVVALAALLTLSLAFTAAARA